MSPASVRSSRSGPDSPLAELSAFAASAGQPELAGEIAEAAGALGRGELTVAVLGQFKRGKSSILNAFAGRPAFPVGILPTTAVPTALVRGPDEVRVLHTSGQTERVPLDRVIEFVSEQHNPGNRRGVARVVVSQPLPEWTQGITFVDSPGIGSASDANTRSARALLPSVDAAIFVLSPDPPITAPEIAFLSDVSAQAAKFFFVVNKIDLLGPAERVELLDYLGSVLRERCGFGSVRLFPTSARLGLADPGPGPAADRTASGLPELWEALRTFLGPGRREAVQRVLRVRVRQFATRLDGWIALAVNASQLASDERERRWAALARGMDDLRIEHRATQAMIEGELRSLEADLPARLSAESTVRVPRITSALRARIPHLAARTAGGLAGAFDEAFRAGVRPEVAEIRSAVTQGVEADLSRLGNLFEERIRRAAERLRALVAQEFGVELAPPAVHVVLGGSARYSDRVEGLFEGTFAGQTVLILPARVLRPGLLRRTPQLVEEEMSAQSGRLRSDLVERIERAWAETRVTVTAQVDRDLRVIEEAVAAGRTSHDAGLEAAARWRGRMEELRRGIAAIAVPDGEDDVRRTASTLGRAERA